MRGAQPFPGRNHFSFDRGIQSKAERSEFHGLIDSILFFTFGIDVPPNFAVSSAPPRGRGEPLARGSPFPAGPEFHAIIIQSGREVRHAEPGPRYCKSRGAPGLSLEMTVAGPRRPPSCWRAASAGPTRVDQSAGVRSAIDPLFRGAPILCPDRAITPRRITRRRTDFATAPRRPRINYAARPPAARLLRNCRRPCLGPGPSSMGVAA